MSALLVTLLLSVSSSGCEFPDLSLGSEDDPPADRASEPVDADEGVEPAGADDQSDAGQVPDEAFQLGGSDVDEEPSPVVRIVEGGTREPRTLNPVLASDPLSEEIGKLVFSGLVRPDPETGDPEPDLASGWQTSDDGSTYTFDLRDDVEWHDGQPFTAHDVVFTFDLMMDDRTRSPRYSRLVERVVSVEAIGDHRVQFHLVSPYAPFLTTFATLGIVPYHLLNDTLPDELVTDPFGISSAIGTGPFELVGWDRADRIVFRANDRYFGKQPQFSEYVYRVLPDDDALVDALETGAIDWARISPSAFNAVHQSEDLTALSIPSFEMVGVVLQLNSGDGDLFHDTRVRQAMLLALDREALVDHVWESHAAVANGTIPPASWVEAEPETHYEYAPDNARELLEEAGWESGEGGIRTRDGAPLQFSLIVNGDNPVRRQIAELITEQWKEIGIDARPEYETWGSVRDRITTTKEFESLLLGYRWDIDPDQHAMWSSDSIPDAFNLGGYVNREVDAILDEALERHARDERARIYGEMQERVLQDLPVLPLAFPNQTVALGPRLHEVEVTAILLRNRANVAAWVPEDEGSTEDAESE